MDNILRRNGYNIKHVKDVLFLPVDNVTGPLPYRDNTNNLVDTSAIILDGVDGWYYYRFTFGQAFWTEDMKENNGELWFEQHLKMFVAKENMNRWLTFEDMERKRFFVIIRDWNNFSRLAGYMNLDDEKVGMRFLEGMQTNPVNGYNTEFYLLSPRKAAACFNLQDVDIEIDDVWPVLPDGGVIDVGPPGDG